MGQFILIQQVVSERAHSDYVLIFVVWSIDHFIMDRWQSLIIPPLFDGTNYAY